MTELLTHPCYFGPIDQFAAFAQSNKILFENEDNYQKQTYRSRQYIYGANGKLLLNIPVKHSRDTGGHQKYNAVKIDNSFPWQRNHWRSIQTAYRTSPFFEFYEDDFTPLYEKTFTHLLDFNYHCLEVASTCLGITLEYDKTKTYSLPSGSETDFRELVSSKRVSCITPKAYPQVFEEKCGFLPNLSILDLLFNEGTNALTYLQETEIQKIS